MAPDLLLLPAIHRVERHLFPEQLLGAVGVEDAAGAGLRQNDARLPLVNLPPLGATDDVADEMG